MVCGMLCVAVVQAIAIARRAHVHSRAGRVPAVRAGWLRMPYSTGGTCIVVLSAGMLSRHVMLCLGTSKLLPDVVRVVSKIPGPDSISSEPSVSHSMA